MVINTNSRMVYPFLSIFARAFGVDIAAISLIMTVRALLGTLSPFLAQITEQRGRKSGILMGILLFLAGVSLVTLWPTYQGFFAGQCVAILGFYLYMSSIQAFLGDAVPYQQRGSMIALIELGWSLALIVGIPLVGFLIGRFGWYAPFPTLVGLGVVSLLILMKAIPADKKRERQQGATWRNFRQVLASPSALAGLMLSMTFVASNEVINLVFGVWLEDSLGVKLAALSIAAAVIGLSEFGGDALSAAVVDRLGKERVIRIALILNAMVALAMPWLGHSLWTAITGLFLFYITFEFGVTSSMPLISEILPGVRATLMGTNTAAYSLGRAAGAILAPLLYALGFRANTIASAVFALIALLALSRIKIHHARPELAVIPKGENT
jgi:MFS transporter, DHA1 family, inner membrane transport protein